MSQDESTRSSAAEPATVAAPHAAGSLWLDWVRRLQAIAQNGLTYCGDPFDRERYQSIRALAAEMAAAMIGETVGRMSDLFACETGPATPKIDVRAALFTAQGILLVRERVDDRWTLPGGWVDVQEPPSLAVAREVLEESGLQCRAVKLLAVWDKNCHGHPPSLYHVYKLVFQCELYGGEPRASLETSAVGFFREAELPPLSSERVTEAQILRLFEHSRHPEWPTDFD